MSLGQSSVEYLATYGWMVVAVSIAGATLYPTIDTGCDIQISDTGSTGSLKVEQAGLTENGTFKVVLDSETRQELLVESLEMESSNNQLKVVQPQTISPGAEIVYSVGQAEKTGSCNTYETTVKFDKGPLKDQKMQIGIKAGINLVETFASLLEITGDSIDKIEIESSVQPTNDTLCIGSQCSETTGTPNENNEYVNYSGDEMTGTLKTSQIEAVCYGKNCTTEQTGETGYVNTEDAQIEGTLNLTELKPIKTNGKLDMK